MTGAGATTTIIRIEAITTTGTPEPIAAPIPDITGIVATAGIPGGIMDGMPTVITIGIGATTMTGIMAAATGGATRTPVARAAKPSPAATVVSVLGPVRSEGGYHASMTT